MKDISVLVGGVTGEGINEVGAAVSRIFNRLGYRVYMYYDFPSLVKGGHCFAIIRASERNISTHSDRVDAVLAMNQDAVDRHRDRWREDTVIIYDPEQVRVGDLPQPTVKLPAAEILKEEADQPAMGGGYCMIGGLCLALGIEWSVCEDYLEKHASPAKEQAYRLARRGYDLAQQYRVVDKIERPALPVLSGSYAVSLGLLKAGLQAYVAYPMTPTSPVLEFLAGAATDFDLHIVPPESEIAVMLMALGYAYKGVKTAVGTSGGGFSLMVEGLGLAGQAELPVVVVMGQRAGPSTGMPTYTAQADLHFVLNASQGEFPRFITVPGDAEEAYYWSGTALNLAWKYQIPAFVLTDKTLGLGLYSFNPGLAGNLQEESPLLWDGTGDYRRYQDTESGVSPLAFPPRPGQVIKVSSYVHDEYGVTAEEPQTARATADKRLRKERALSRELEGYQTVKVYGQGKTALLCWGSNKGVCLEIAEKFGLKVIQMLVLSPFPEKALAEAVDGVERIISVECNSTGQLAKLLRQQGYKVDDLILKYDGRPFSLEDLENEVKRVIV